MSYVTLASQGMAAVESRNWDEAITKLSAALEHSSNPLWLLARSKALVGASRFQEALVDADRAWHFAYDRNKRDLMTESHYRRAVAFYRLKEYANADACCFYTLRLLDGAPAVEREDPVKAMVDEKGFWKGNLAEVKRGEEKEKREGADAGIGKAMEAPKKIDQEKRKVGFMRMQILSAMGKLPEDDPARKVGDVWQSKGRKLADDWAAEKKPGEKKDASSPADEIKETVPSVAAPKAARDAPLRLEDFQSDSTMSVTIFSKGNQKDGLKVDFLPRSVALDGIIHPNGEVKPFQLDLWGEIDTETSKHTVTPSKVELSLKKKHPGKWPQLRSDGALSPEARAMASPKSTATPSPAAQPSAKGPAYPTSSTKGSKDWDKIGSEADDPDFEGSGVNEFFKQIYAKAGPEERRAMMKSFTESNGTSLSTDWNSVKDGVVETKPPEGVQAKKWEK